MARTLRFPSPAPPPPQARAEFSDFHTDDAIGISIRAVLPTPPADPTFDVVIGKEGHTHRYRIFEQDATPGAWTLATQADDHPAHVEPIESRDEARELVLLLREQIAQQLREGWHVVRGDGMANSTGG